MDVDQKNQPRRSRVSRRDFMKVAGVGATAAAVGSVVTIRDAAAQSWDEERDIVIVGSGAAALSAAAAGIMKGASVIVLEKAASVGGTTAKSGGAFWIPNSPFMQEAGLNDPRDDAIRYMARLAYPHRYREDHSTLGIPDASYELISTFYDHGARVTETLHTSGAMRSLMGMSWTGQPTPDYFAHLEENKAPRGRTTNPMTEDGGSGFGITMINQLRAYAENNGATILTEHRVTKIVVDENRRVVGVEVESPDGVKRVRGVKGVIFGSGGFTHNVPMRMNYQRTPVHGGCAVPSNTGDLVNMAIEIGAKLGNMNEAWLQQEVLEEVLEFSSVPSGTWFLGGDSMIAVNRYGHRLYDEKFVYNERTRTHLTWEPLKAEYPNLYQFMIFDDHAIDYGGMLMPSRETDFPAYIIQGATLSELASNIDDRLASLEPQITRFRLADSFLDTLQDTIARFNEYAETGKDLEFNRGEAPIDEHFHVPGDNNDKPNPYMYPISDEGPFYAIILAAGTLDTKGGPATSTSAQVLDTKDEVIEGFYAAGNCAASAAGQAYWGAGGTLGPAVTFGYLAGEHAAQS